MKGLFYKVIHRSENNINIGKIKQNDVDLAGFNADLGKHKNVAVYFFLEKSESLATPLIIQFGDKDIYYVYDQKDNWKKAEGIKSETLETDIPKQRCKRNKAHKIELSSDSKYNCFICEVQIKVEKQKNYAQYSFYTVYCGRGSFFCFFICYWKYSLDRYYPSERNRILVCILSPWQKWISSYYLHTSGR